MALKMRAVVAAAALTAAHAYGDGAARPLRDAAAAEAAVRGAAGSRLVLFAERRNDDEECDTLLD